METSHTKPQHLRHCFQADSHGFANPSSLSVRSDFEVIGEGSEKIYSSGRFKAEQIYSIDHSTIVKNIVNYDLVEEVYPGTAFPLRSAAETHASNEVCEPCAQELSAFRSKGSKHSEIMDTDTGIREARIYQAPNLHDSLIQDQQLAFPLQVSKSPNWESARQVITKADGIKSSSNHLNFR